MNFKSIYPQTLNKLHKNFRWPWILWSLFIIWTQFYESSKVYPKVSDKITGAIVSLIIFVFIPWKIRKFFSNKKESKPIRLVEKAEKRAGKKALPKLQKLLNAGVTVNAIIFFSFAIYYFYQLFLVLPEELKKVEFVSLSEALPWALNFLKDSLSASSGRYLLFSLVWAISFRLARYMILRAKGYF